LRPPLVYSLPIADYLDHVTQEHIDFDFSRSQSFADHLKKHFPLPPSILIGGTNGKGSTLAFLKNILIAHNIRVGGFTSPHLIDVKERIQINHAPISHKDFEMIGAEVLAIFKNLDLTCTYFETMTFLAWMYFSKQKPDVCLFEVGLGGRLDTTNTIDRFGSIITKIDMDHMDLLGPTLSHIAQEKLPILSPSGFNVMAKQDVSIKSQIRNHLKTLAVCKTEHDDFSHSHNDMDYSFHSKDFQINSIELGLRGKHQATNASLALSMALEVFKEKKILPNPKKIEAGLASTRIAGRFDQHLYHDRTMILDIAHNPASVKGLVQTMRETYPNQPLAVLLGCSGNKAHDNMHRQLATLTGTIYTTAFKHPRSWKQFQNQKLDFTDLKTALSTILIKTTQETLILCTGSIFLIGNIKALLDKGNPG